MNMIEKVAKVIQGLEGCTLTNCSHCRRIAKEAIIAMREPTEEMLQNVAVTGLRPEPKDMLDKYNRDKEYGKLTYQSMIDAALKE